MFTAIWTSRSARQMRLGLRISFWAEGVDLSILGGSARPNSGEETHANDMPYVMGCPVLGGHAVSWRFRLGAVYRQYSGHGRRPERGRGGAGQSGPPEHRDAGFRYDHDRRLRELSFPE